MCGRFTQKKEADEIEEELDIELWDDKDGFLPSFNVAPTHSVPVLTQNGVRKAQSMRWGLIPHWADDVNIGSKMINARLETLSEKPSFRNLISDRRCVVFCDGYFEWKRNGKEKTPYYITQKTGKLLCFAGLWESAKLDGNEYTTFTVITTEPLDSVAHIHHRMPVILDQETMPRWLNCKDVDKETALSDVGQARCDLQAQTVSSFVNSVSNNSPQCIEPVPEQGELF